MSKIEVFDRRYTDHVPVGQRDDGTDLALLLYRDGTVRMLHECKTVGEDRLVCAPALRIGNGHDIHAEDIGCGLMSITVSPSILCPDCDLHGFVRSSSWESC
jgi:hypothetical protein